MKKEKIIEPIDSSIFEDYSNKWVVIAEDNKTVIKSGDTVADIKDSWSKGTVMFVPDNNFAHITSFNA